MRRRRFDYTPRAIARSRHQAPLFGAIDGAGRYFAFLILPARHQIWRRDIERTPDVGDKKRQRMPAGMRYF